MDRRTDGQTCRWTDMQKDESIDIHSCGGTKRHMNEGTHGQTESFLDKHTS
jgi:hypothetical protein